MGQEDSEDKITHRLPRVSVFIDGFNLYYGLKEAKFDRYLWLDLFALSETFLQPGQTLASVDYFTAAVREPFKRKRQSDYLEALSTHGNTRIVRGYYQSNTVECFGCGRCWDKPEEKKSDVSIATSMVVGGLRDRYDVAILISGDSDLVPAVEAVRSECPGKLVFARFPPSRVSQELRRCCNGAQHISDSQLRKSQLPEEVAKPDGYVLKRPASWK